MAQVGPLTNASARFRRLRFYRGLVNVYPPLLVIAIAALVFWWMFPWLFSVLVWVWAVDALVVLALAVPWVSLSWAFARGKIRCPACAGPVATRFQLLIPKTCASCGCDITAPKTGAISGSR